jgi:hypothetical protein
VQPPRPWAPSCGLGGRDVSGTQTAPSANSVVDAEFIDTPGRRAMPLLRRDGIAGVAARVAVAGLLAGGCVGPVGGPLSASTSPSLPPAARDYVLPEFQKSVGGIPVACAGVAYIEKVVIRGSADDPALAWIAFSDGRRENLVWPSGFRARFVPKPKILHASGRGVARDGDLATGDCPMPPSGVLIDAANAAPKSPPLAVATSRRGAVAADHDGSHKVHHSTGHGRQETGCSSRYGHSRLMPARRRLRPGWAGAALRTRGWIVSGHSGRSSRADRLGSKYGPGTGPDVIPRRPPGVIPRLASAPTGLTLEVRP